MHTAEKHPPYHVRSKYLSLLYQCRICSHNTFPHTHYRSLQSETDPKLLQFPLHYKVSKVCNFKNSKRKGKEAGNHSTIPLLTSKYLVNGKVTSLSKLQIQGYKNKFKTVFPNWCPTLLCVWWKVLKPLMQVATSIKLFKLQNCWCYRWPQMVTINGRNLTLPKNLKTV